MCTNEQFQQQLNKKSDMLKNDLTNIKIFLVRENSIFIVTCIIKRLKSPPGP